MEEVTRTICSVPKVFAFRIPPATRADGFRASDWPKDPVWTGALRLVARGDKGFVLLEHTDKAGLFAQCPLGKRAVEPVTDSSRYFVIRVSDGKGRHANLGIGFSKRDAAFDFKVAVQDWKNKGGDAADERAAQFINALPDQDFSLKEGQKIRVNFKVKKPEKVQDDQGWHDAKNSDALFLTGPPGDVDKEDKKKKKKKKKKHKHEQSASADGGQGHSAATQQEDAASAFVKLALGAGRPLAASAATAPGASATAAQATPASKPIPANWIAF